MAILSGRTGAIALCFAVFAGGAAAQDGDESTNRVATETAWSVFVEDDADRKFRCWGVSAPRETTNTRDGREVSVQRGDILLMVFYGPEENIQGQVAFTGGYPFGTPTVTIDVGGTAFEMFTEGEWAWPANEGDDDRIVTAMKSGAEATVVGRSTRGTQTSDTFSLMGFTAAVEEAERRCEQSASN